MKAIKATPRIPNPKKEQQRNPEPAEDDTNRDEEVPPEEAPKPDIIVTEEMEVKRRDFRVTQAIIDRF